MGLCFETGRAVKGCVPDMDILTKMYSDRERFDKNDRFALMRMIFGGRFDRYDYHDVGLNHKSRVDSW